MDTSYLNSGNNSILAGTNAAEESCDPLEGLVETDPGAAFSPEVLERLDVDDISPATSLSKAELPFAGWLDTSQGSSLGDERNPSDRESSAAADGDGSGDAVNDDVLAGLVEKTMTDPAAPFTPECLTELAELKKRDRHAFEKLRLQLRHAGCRVCCLRHKDQ
jgi:hypothetical protein